MATRALTWMTKIGVMNAGIIFALSACVDGAVVSGAADAAARSDANDQANLALSTAESCGANGAWLLEYDPATSDNGSPRYPMILHIDGESVGVEAELAYCDAPVTEARWGDGCVLEVTASVAPCGTGQHTPILQATIDFSSDAVSGSANWMLSDGRASDPIAGELRVNATRVESARCAPTQYGGARVTFSWQGEDAVSFVGPVDVTEIEEVGPMASVTVEGAEGSLSFPLPANAAASLAVGQPLDLELDLDNSPWSQECAFVLTHADGGKLVAAGIGGTSAWLNKGPLARANLSFDYEQTCAPQWTRGADECRALITPLQLTTDGAPRGVAAGQSQPIGFGQQWAVPLIATVVVAESRDYTECSDTSPEWFEFTVTPEI